MKTCTKCGFSQEESCFSKRADVPDGLKSQCKKCDRLYSQSMDKEKRNHRHAVAKKDRLNKLRLKMLDFLSDKKCALCPEVDPVVMEFDHLDPSLKEYSVSETIERCFSWNRVKKEIDKCQILCANCHRRKTAKDFGYYKSLPLN